MLQAWLQHGPGREPPGLSELPGLSALPAWTLVQHAWLQAQTTPGTPVSSAQEPQDDLQPVETPVQQAVSQELPVALLGQRVVSQELPALQAASQGQQVQQAVSLALWVFSQELPGLQAASQELPELRAALPGQQVASQELPGQRVFSLVLQAVLPGQRVQQVA